MRRAQDQVIRSRWRLRAAAGEVQVIRGCESQLIEKIDRLEHRLQLVVAIGPTPHNAQIQIQFRRGADLEHYSPGALSRSPATASATRAKSATPKVSPRRD